jgi:hypothetical protein
MLVRLLEKSGAELSDEQIEELVQKASSAAAEAVARNLRDSRLEMLLDHAALRRGFEIRLRDPWGEALDGLYTLHVVAFESAEGFDERTREGAAADDDLVWEALMRLQARGCHVASEIHALLRTGHAEGAYARWRTLHELAVIGSFLADHDRELARRYLEHDAISSWWDAQFYQRHAEKLGEDPFTDEEMAEMAADRAGLLATYGKDYDDAWGWAAGVLKRPTFAAIEEATNLEHWRPYVRDASQATHAGPRRLTYRLGTDDAVQMRLGGPSNLGLQEAGINAAISLTMITVTTLLHRVDLEAMITAKAMLELSHETQEAFFSAFQVLQERVEAERLDETRRERRRQRDRARRSRTPNP